MDKKRSYCVYMHKNKMSGKVYIGITGGNPEYRWANGKGYEKNDHFTYSINKYGWDNFEHIILFDGLTKKEAENKEIELISYYDSTNQDNGYNIQKGGNLTQSKTVYQYDRYTGQFIDKYESMKMAEKYTGVNASDISSVCRGIRNASKLYYFSYTFLGDALSRDILEVIKTNNNKVKVAQYDFNGNLIRIYNSISEANNVLLGKDRGRKSITFQHRTSYGYIWKRIEDESHIEEKISDDELMWRLDDSRSYEMSVCQYSMNGTFLNCFKNMAIASRETNVCQCSISLACKGKFSHAGEYFWKFSDEVVIGNNLTEKEVLRLKGKIQSLKTGVIQYDVYMNILNIYDSMNIAAKLTGVNNISKCCQRKSILAGGFIWRYVYDPLTDDEYISIKDKVFKEYEKYKAQHCRLAQYDLSGNLLSVFKNKDEACKAIGVKNINLHKKSYAGFMWRLLDDGEQPLDKIEPYKINKTQAKKVYQYDLDWNFLNSYESTGIAAKEVSGTQTTISKCCINEKKAYGFMWSYKYYESPLLVNK